MGPTQDDVMDDEYEVFIISFESEGKSVPTKHQFLGYSHLEPNESKGNVEKEIWVMFVLLLLLLLICAYVRKLSVSKFIGIWTKQGIHDCIYRWTIQIEDFSARVCPTGRNSRAQAVFSSVQRSAK